MAEIYQLPENGNNNGGFGNIPFSIPIGGFGNGFGGGFGYGMNERNIQKSLRILSAPNTGMAISNNDLRMTAIYIGNATSPSEFWSTVNHELYHATVAIIDYYGEPYDEEPAAYLQGELMKMATKEIGEPCK